MLQSDPQLKTFVADVAAILHRAHLRARIPGHGFIRDGPDLFSRNLVGGRSVNLMSALFGPGIDLFSVVIAAVGVDSAVAVAVSLFDVGFEPASLPEGHFAIATLKSFLLLLPPRDDLRLLRVSLVDPPEVGFEPASVTKCLLALATLEFFRLRASFWFFSHG